MNPLLYRCVLSERFSQLGAGGSAVQDGTRLPRHCGYLLWPWWCQGCHCRCSSVPRGMAVLLLLAARL